MNVDGQKKEGNIYLKSQNKFNARDYARDSDNQKLTYSWALLPESSDQKSGGDSEAKPEQIEGLIKNKRSHQITFQAPAIEGGYRLFVTISDGKKEAYANIPFYVSPRNANEPPVRFVNLKKTDLNSFNIE